jgi:hypothetical protein
MERAVRGIEEILLGKAPRFCRPKGLTEDEVSDLAQLLTEAVEAVQDERAGSR